MPSVEKLWNGRYRLEFFCKIQNPNEGWYSDSIDKWLPEFGTLQDADFAGEGWSARDGEAYPDMRLVKCEAKYIAPSETHLVTLTYETLTASWVAEKDEDIDYELNGLQRVNRTFVALPDTSYSKVVGTDTITVGGDTLTLGAFKIEKTDSMWSLTETWLENDVVLSRNIQTKSGGKLIVETVEVFNGTPSAETAGAVQIGSDVSDFEGIPTRRFTFAKGAGQISVDTRPAATSLAGCKYVTVRSLGTPVTPTGVIVAESETESDGYITYEKTALQGTIAGTKQTYEDVIDVEVPGIVDCTTEDISIIDNVIGNITGTIAVPKVTPRRSKKIAATVTVEITTTPPSTTSLAYDLGQISCSVTSVSKSYTSKNGPTRYVKGGIFNIPYTDWSRSYSPSARIQVYPGCYLSNASSTGSVSYNSQKTYLLDPDEDGDGYYDGYDSDIDSSAFSGTSCTGEGSTSDAGYVTTGILQRSSRPVLTTLDGTTYYEVITWSV